MRLAHQFQGQTVKGHGYRPAGAYRVGLTRRLVFLDIFWLIVIRCGVDK